MKFTLWHGSDKLLSELDPQATSDTGLHCGTYNQAIMRNSAYLYQIEASFIPGLFRRTRDEGGDWLKKIKRARADKAPGIRYLNRYEGIPTARIEQLVSLGGLEKLNHLDDAGFKEFVPEAKCSYIFLDRSQFEVVGVFQGKQFNQYYCMESADTDYLHFQLDQLREQIPQIKDIGKRTGDEPRAWVNILYRDGFSAYVFLQTRETAVRDKIADVLKLRVVTDDEMNEVALLRKGRDIRYCGINAYYAP